MKNVIHIFHRFVNDGTVTDIAFDEFDIETFQIGTVAAAQTVKNTDICLALKMFHKMTADKAGTAGNENTHS